MEVRLNRRLGLLGGTFNPVHTGHLILAQDALEQYELDQVLLVPCASPPHKEPGRLLPAEHRLAMLELAIEGDPRLAVSKVEIERGGVSYSVDTVRQLKRLFPDADLRFIIGADSLTELHLWKDIGELVGLCDFITFERPGFDCSSLTPARLALGEEVSRRLLDNVTRGHLLAVSSSEIRARVAEAMSIRYLVPPGVEMYIFEHGLYKT